MPAWFAEEMEKNCFGHFSNGTDWRQLCFGMTNDMMSLDLPLPDISSAFFFRCMTIIMFHECDTDYFTVNITEILMHAYTIGTRLLLCGLGTRLTTYLPC